MGGEGVDWVSHAMFTKVPHVFQNLGDGTYYHSGYLAIRQAVAAKATLTYKILFNDAVAMTGGQPVDGIISVDGIARQVEAEGVKQVVVRLRRHRQVRRDPRPLPRRHRVPRPRRARCGAAPPARDAGRHGADLRADLRGREAPPPQEGRAGRSGAAPVHQRPGLRRLRRLLGAEQLRRGAAAGDAAGPQAQDRPEQLQQGLLVREGLLSELRRRAGRTSRASGPARSAAARPSSCRMCRRCRNRRLTPGTRPTTCWSPASVAPASSPSARCSRWRRTSKARAPACWTSWASRRRAARC